MISFLASPKPFKGHNAIIQKRAIHSWLKVHPAAEVILYGNSEGTDGTVGDLDRTTHVPNIQASTGGVPLFNAIADHARQNAAHDLQVYVNCDMLFPQDMVGRLAAADLEKFLIVGQRLNLSPGVEFDIEMPDWLPKIKELIEQNSADLYAASGMDYFIFRRGTWHQLASLIVGRGGYDGALVAFCLRHHIPVIDATWSLPALHQFHDYSHVVGGFRESHHGYEAMLNYQIHDIMHSTPNTIDADFQLRGGRLVAKKCRGDRLRTLELRLRYEFGLKRSSLLLRTLWRLGRSAGIISNHEPSLTDVVSGWCQTPAGAVGTTSGK